MMHIVSDISGTLKAGMDGFDLIRSSFPAGTVTGAPKIRAMEIIDEIENVAGAGLMPEPWDTSIFTATWTRA